MIAPIQFSRLVTQANPLRKDPTRTLSLRQSWMKELERCAHRLIDAIWDFMVEKDALGLEARLGIQPASSLAAHVVARQYEFRTHPQKLQVFQDWFKEMVDAHILSPDPDTKPGEPWTTEYVESAYRRGLLNAFIAARDPLGVDQSSESFLRSSFGQPETLSKVQLLGTRSYEQLKGYTAAMSSETSRILAQGLADGRGPRDIAQELRSKVEGLTNKRALTIARTEIINAHSEGQLDAFQRLGVEEVGLKAEWSTAGDERVCPLCLPLEGQVFSIQEARGLIPYHPNCRCAWIPFIGEVQEKPASQAPAPLPPPAPVPVPEPVVPMPSPTPPPKPLSIEQLVEKEVAYYKQLAQALHPTVGTEEQKRAFRSYQRHDYKEINTHLRSGTAISKKGQNTITVMDEAIASAKSSEDLVLYRGAKIKGVPGSLIEDKAFVSATTRPKVAGDFVGENGEGVKILVPKGTNMVAINRMTGWDSYESEFVLPRGTKYMVTDRVDMVDVPFFGPTPFRVVELVPDAVPVPLPEPVLPVPKPVAPTPKPALTLSDSYQAAGTSFDFAGYSELEKGAIAEYQAAAYGSKVGGYSTLQQYARSGTVPSYLLKNGVTEAQVQSYLQELDAALKKTALAKDQVLYRGIRNGPEVFGITDLSQLKVGHTFTDKGFISTTTSKDVATKFTKKLNYKEQPYLIQIQAKAGQSALSPDVIEVIGEKEVLLPRNSTFKVTKIEGNKVTVEIVSADVPVAEPVVPVPAKPSYSERESAQAYQDLIEQMHQGQTITASERAAVADYQQMGFREINRHLRKDRPISPERLAEITELDNLIARTTLPEPVLVYRGGVPEGWKPGSIIEDRGFVSSSTSWKEASRFTYEGETAVTIRVPAGSKAIGVDLVSGMTEKQNELLLPRGSRFRVTDEVVEKVKEDGTKILVRVLELL